MTHNPSIIRQGIAPIIPSTRISQNILNQQHISRPSTLYRNQVSRTISQPNITPTQQILNSSVISKPITAGIRSINNVSKNSRNISIKSPSKYPTNISSVLTQPSVNVNKIAQVNTTHLNQNRSLSSPVVNRPIRTSPLFPKINTNTVRH